MEQLFAEACLGREIGLTSVNKLSQKWGGVLGLGLEKDVFAFQQGVGRHFAEPNVERWYSEHCAFAGHTIATADNGAGKE